MPAPHNVQTLLTIIGLTAGVGIASALVATCFIVLPDRVRRRLVPHLVSFATGALLGATLLGLLPSAIESAGIAHVQSIGAAVLAGLVLFFVLEKFVLWRHCHDDPCEAHSPNDEQRRSAVGPMIVWGDGLHNVLDGVVIAAAYLTAPALGVSTAAAVFAHELPQEIGDIAVLLHSGMGRLRALGFNLLIGACSVLGGIVAFYAMAHALSLLPYALALAGSSLLYVAVADLIPGLHRHVDLRRSVEQLLLIVAGVVVIWLTQHHDGSFAGAELR